MRFVEDATLDREGVRITHDGYMVGNVKCARMGIQQYAGHEIGKPDLGIVNVYRPENVVFSKDSIATFAGKPVTDDHPDEAVNSENWKEYAVGDIGEEVMRDGEFIRVPIKLMDKAIIKKVEAGKREISMGYDMSLEWVDGTAPDGTPYQAIMKDLRMNHLAIVDRARAGHEARIGDNAANAGNRTTWGAKPLNDNSTQEMPNMADQLNTTVVVGDNAVQIAASDASKLEAFKTAQDKKLSDAEAAHKEAIAAKDKELAAKDAKIADLEKNVLDEAAIDAKVKDRAALVDNARKLSPEIKIDGLSDADIKKTAVEAVRGADATKDKSDDYINAAFDLALESVGIQSTDSVADAMKDRNPVAAQANDGGQSNYERLLQDAHKPTTKEA